MKRCNTCLDYKNSNCFAKNRSKPDGLVGRCRSCQSEYDRKRRALDPETEKLRSRMWRARNQEKVRTNNREWRATNWEKIKQKRREYYATRKNDPRFKLAKNLRTRISGLLKGRFKPGSSVLWLGCSLDHLKKHLESKFKPGMSWDNYGIKGWHVDHVIPLARFELADPEQFARACHYMNLQPMWAIDNIKKSSNLMEEV